MRLYKDANRPVRYEDSWPVVGTLVCFFNSKYPHAVLATERDRPSITNTLSRREA